jgi:branched-chain amino acid transport system permease protein/neutral amino acid transport system permease protein
LIADLLQLLINGILSGAQLAVPAIGFTTIYAVLRFPNFAIASHASVGAYAGVLVNTLWGWPVAASLGVAFLVTGVVGVASDTLVLRRLRPSGPLTTAIGAAALGIVLENVLRFAFGNDPIGFDLPVLRDWRIGLGPLGALRVGPQAAEAAAASLIMMALLFLFLGFTRSGRMMRAVADNTMLAGLKGIDAESVARRANFVGMGLAGFGGVLIGLDTAVDPLTGARVVLAVFAAAVVGGLGSIPGAVAGAFVVGIGEELSTLVLDPSYRTAVGFAAILLVLTLRPRGLLGERAL